MFLKLDVYIHWAIWLSFWDTSWSIPPNANGRLHFCRFITSWIYIDTYPCYTWYFTCLLPMRIDREFMIMLCVCSPPMTLLFVFETCLSSAPYYELNGCVSWGLSGRFRRSFETNWHVCTPLCSCKVMASKASIARIHDSIYPKVELRSITSSPHKTSTLKLNYALSPVHHIGLAP